MSRSVTSSRANRLLLLQIETTRWGPPAKSQSVTGSRPNRFQMLQIEMNERADNPYLALA
ncbi:hypothetical protein I0600191H4_05180 [Collinsella sp. i06-0019-1H4]